MSDIRRFSIPIKNFSEEQSDNPQFLRTKYYAISEGQNLNRSSFDINGMKKCLESEDYANKPILGAWDKTKVSEVGLGNFDGHNSDVGVDLMSGEQYNTYLGEKNERPLGMILPHTAKIEEYKGKQWLTFEGCIWVEYNREVVKLLRKKRTNNVSVEIRVLDYEIDANGIEIIKDFTLLGITIIGVEAGIPNACVNLFDYTQTPKYGEFVRAFSKYISGDKNFKTELGSGEALKIDLSKESASDDGWGDIDKTLLRNKLLEASNYKSIIPKAYLVVEDGWEDAPSEKLKYPVVQIKGDAVVLNINGIETAGAYLMKEKDRSYFNSAKAKLNRYRKILGMEKFGLETNDDWGTLVSQIQPNIIKMGATMNKKEIVTKLSALFANQPTLLAKYTETKAKFEDKEGEYAVAEDSEKEKLKEEMEALRVEMEASQGELFGCGEDIMNAFAQLVKAEEDEEDDVEDDEDEENEDECKMACDKFGATFISKTKTRIVYSKDGEFYCCQFEVKDGEILFAEEKQKVDKIFATIHTGGCITKEDNLPMPAILVEMTRGITAKELEVREKFSAKDSIIAEKEAKFIEMESAVAEKEATIAEVLEQSKRYKKYVAEYIPKYEEIVGKEQVSKDFKDEIFNKIYDMKFSNLEEMETKIHAHLYQLHRAEILGGTFPSASKIDATKNTDDYNKIIKKYK